MADDVQKDGTPPLPPKLDLRKSGVLKSAPTKGANTPEAAPAPKPVAAVKPVAPKPVAAVRPVAAAPATPASKPIVPQSAPKPVAAVKPVAPKPVAAIKPVAPKPVAAVISAEAKAPEQPVVEIAAPVAPAPKPVVPQPAPKPVVAVKPAPPKPVAAIKPVAPKPVAAVISAEAKAPEQPAAETAAPVAPAPKPVAPQPAPKPVAAVIKPTAPKPVAAIKPAAPKPVAVATPPAEAANEETKLPSETMRITLDTQPAAETPKPPVSTMKPVAPKPVVAKLPQQPEPEEQDISSQTMRITLDSQPTVAAKPVAPKPLPRPAGAATPTTQKPAAPKPVASKTIVRPKVSIQSKSETSKIPLNAAKVSPPAANDDAAPKTIRIKPTASAAQKIAAPKPAVPQPVAAINADKSKTSRISLESAMTADNAPSTATSKGPKTIKLKKPSEAATVKVAKGPNQTAPIEGAAEDSPTQTRKKTIKVKRPSQRTGKRKKPALKVGGAASAAPAAPVNGEEAIPGAAPVAVAPVEIPDKPNVTFHIFAFAAIFVAIATIIVLCSQALGPNSCLTQYSWWKEGPNIGLPGKISMSTQY